MEKAADIQYDPSFDLWYVVDILRSSRCSRIDIGRFLELNVDLFIHEWSETGLELWDDQ